MLWHEKELNSITNGPFVPLNLKPERVVVHTWMLVSDLVLTFSFSYDSNMRHWWFFRGRRWHSQVQQIYIHIYQCHTYLHICIWRTFHVLRIFIHLDGNKVPKRCSQSPDHIPLVQGSPCLSNLHPEADDKLCMQGIPLCEFGLNDITCWRKQIKTSHNIAIVFYSERIDINARIVDLTPIQTRIRYLSALASSSTESFSVSLNLSRNSTGSEIIAPSFVPISFIQSLQVKIWALIIVFASGTPSYETAWCNGSILRLSPMLTYFKTKFFKPRNVVKQMIKCVSVIWKIEATMTLLYCFTWIAQPTSAMIRVSASSIQLWRLWCAPHLFSLLEAHHHNRQQNLQWV